MKKEKTAEYDLPVLTAGVINQGLDNYAPREGATLIKNVISISANGANTGVTFYQPNDFTILQDAYAIYYKKDKDLNKLKYLFFVSAISKSIYGKYSWTKKAGWTKVKKDKIYLPIKNNEIDFEFMENLISAVQKLVIKGVVEYADKRIKCTKEVVEKNN